MKTSTSLLWSFLTAIAIGIASLTFARRSLAVSSCLVGSSRRTQTAGLLMGGTGSPWPRIAGLATTAAQLLVPCAVLAVIPLIAFLIFWSLFSMLTSDYA